MPPPSAVDVVITGRGPAVAGDRETDALGGPPVTDYSLRFDNPVLQQRFLTELQRQKVPYGLGPNQAVECSSDEWSAVNAVAHVVRDGCFKWYFSWWKTQRETERFLEAVRKSGLPFELEHHKDGIVFLLARANATAYESVMDDLEPVHVLQMIDHCNLPVTDLERSQRFYERVLEPLGYHFLLRDGLAAGFGREAWNFGIVATPPPLPQPPFATAQHPKNQWNTMYF